NVCHCCFLRIRDGCGPLRPHDVRIDCSIDTIRTRMFHVKHHAAIKGGAPLVATYPSQFAASPLASDVSHETPGTMAFGVNYHRLSCPVAAANELCFTLEVSLRHMVLSDRDILIALEEGRIKI